MLDFAECDRARLTRDPRYDGRFFTGVRSTGVYCRPVCPVRKPLSRNVCFFPSAAAAELAGFRPCLRCRPETAPFCPAWKGSRTTVDRAMRLIVEEGALDAENARVEDLAERLGIGARQLTRLFTRHLNATPIQVAKTARVQRAKRLLDLTELPMTDVAMRAGFASLCRSLPQISDRGQAICQGEWAASASRKSALASLGRENRRVDRGALTLRS